LYNERLTLNNVKVYLLKTNVMEGRQNTFIVYPNTKSSNYS